jgi:Family of unknown function (DUF6286)
VILLRALVRLVSFLLLLMLAVLGGAVAPFSIQGGDTGLSIPALAEIVRLPELRETLDGFLRALEGSGPVAAMTLLGATAAFLLGVLLLIGVLVPRRERMVALDSSERGKLAARRRPLAQLATALAERAEGVTQARVRVRPRRASGGRVDVRAERTPAAEPESVKQAVAQALEPLTGPFKLKARSSSRLGGSGSRVQ